MILISQKDKDNRGTNNLSRKFYPSVTHFRNLQDMIRSIEELKREMQMLSVREREDLLNQGELKI